MFFSLVVYDNELTDAFISTLVYLSTVIIESPPLIIISMEKRYDIINAFKFLLLMQDKFHTF